MRPPNSDGQRPIDDFTALKERASHCLDDASRKLAPTTPVGEKSPPGTLRRLALQIETVRSPLLLSVLLDETALKLRGMQKQVGDERAKQALADASREIDGMAPEALPLIGSVPLWTSADLCPLGTPLREYVRRCGGDGRSFRQLSVGARSGIEALLGAIWGRVSFRKDRIRRLAESLGSETDGPDSARLFRRFSPPDTSVVLSGPAGGALVGEWSSVWELVLPIETRCDVSFVATRYEDRVLALWYDEFLQVAEL